MERSTFDLGLQIKSIDEATPGVFEGYASVFGAIDQHYDIVSKGAFKKSIKGRKPVMLWQHRASEPIGIFEVVKEDEKGLFVKGVLNMDVQAAREAYALLKQGAITGMSIGYNAIKWAWDEKKGVRTLEEVELWEISLVTFPANTLATVTDVKELGGLTITQIKKQSEYIAGEIKNSMERLTNLMRVN